MKMNLNGPWTLEFTDPVAGKGVTIPAQVPGNVLGDLYRSGVIPDPYFGNNSVALRPYEFVDWTYRTVFTAPVPEKGERAELVFGGIDTVAEIFLNGEALGKACNMFVEHRFDASALLRPGEENELLVMIRSSVNYARQFAGRPGICSLSCNFEGLFLRRAMHTYGWDIEPRLVGAGLWRSVSLETLPPERWTDLYLATVHLSGEGALLALSWNFETDAPALDGFECFFSMRCGDLVFEQAFPLYFVNGLRHMTVPDPVLWHPAGSGEPALYEVSMELRRRGKTVDVRRWKTGIRTIRLKRTETLDRDGNGEFVFEVNGKAVFIKGSNWVPADALHGEHPERVSRHLELFRNLGCNMVRCWGGGVYEDEAFFDECDRSGLLVWQDFMFACELPPNEPWFQETVREELRKVILRLRNHPSLALWCGDNEGDEFFFGEHSVYKKLPPSTNTLTRRLFPEVVAAFDPLRDYLPSSPFLSDELWKTGERCRSPEQHLWGPRDYWKSDFYRRNTAIFAGEIGYHGLPHLSSIRRFVPEESLNGRAGDSVWNTHASQPYGTRNGSYSYRIGLMETQVRNAFGSVPPDLETYVRASQFVQAEAFKYFIESFRCRKWKKTGILWWNLADSWPQFSDAVVDYYYAKKLAYYYIRSSQRPFLLMFDEATRGVLPLYAVNDTRHAVSGTFRVSEPGTGETLLSGEFRADADASAKIAEMAVEPQKRAMFLIEWNTGPETRFNHYLHGPVPFELSMYEKAFSILAEKLYPDFSWLTHRT
ncbi:MAG: Exo-beta-D-glucosaminidase precursor [Lentisphaerae bacterium ADurb.Bin242]|nr:MAG: Exo-beta-D-glucosaminidase precursor [Lentisphaerae bacterium ADurb.Bin242]